MDAFIRLDQHVSDLLNLPAAEQHPGPCTVAMTDDNDDERFVAIMRSLWEDPRAISRRLGEPGAVEEARNNLRLLMHTLRLGGFGELGIAVWNDTTERAEKTRAIRLGAAEIFDLFGPLFTHEADHLAIDQRARAYGETSDSRRSAHRSRRTKSGASSRAEGNVRPARPLSCRRERKRLARRAPGDLQHARWPTSQTGPARYGGGRRRKTRSRSSKKRADGGAGRTPRE